jgi:thiamine-monophosphate kinase
MAARPIAAFVSLAVPRTGCGIRSRLELATLLYEGLLPLASEFGVAIAGGDTNTHDGPTVISVTALGEVGLRGPLTRSGGQAGDWLLVTGAIGGSMAGHHFDFTPRVREAMLLHERYDLHAGMDISDGLSLDAARLVAASGCGAVIDLDKIPLSAAARELADPVSHALGDGEDFELLLAAPPEVARAIVADACVDCAITCVGELTDQQGLWYQAPDGTRSPATPIGWQH